MSNPTQPLPQQPPKKKRRVGRVVLLASLGVVLTFSSCGVGMAMGSSGGQDVAATSKPAVTKTVAGPVVTETKAGPVVTHTKTVTKQTAGPVVTKTVTEKPAAKPTHAAKPAAPAHTAVFKVWGTGSVDAQYGNDGTNIQGPSHPGWTRTLKVHDDALYYAITAQLNGGGNVHCSVTIDGHTKTGHASGGYNICSAQLNSDFLGGWS